MPGIVSSISNGEEIIFAENADFSGNPEPSKVNGLQTNGQIWVGTTAVNAGGTHINVGTLTSPNGSVTIGYSSPNITLDVAASNDAILTVTPDFDFDGTAATPISPQSGNLNALSYNPSTANVTNAYNSTGAATGNLQIEHKAWLTPLVVDPSTTIGTRGTFSSLTAALTAATSGQTIFLRPGTYNVDPTLKAGVNICAFDCDSETPNVTINGLCTMSTAGTVTISGIRLKTNGAPFLTVSGSVASIVNLKNCYLSMTDSGGITFSSSSSSARINIDNCKGDLSITNIRLWTHTSAGILTLGYSSFTNSGGSVLPSTCSSGAVLAAYCNFTTGLSFSSTGILAAHDIEVNCLTQNVTALTANGGSSSVGSSSFSSGTASAVTVGTGSILGLANCGIQSTNTNAITGAGTLNYTGMFFTDTSSTINTTTQTVFFEGTRRSTMQPAFFMQCAGMTDATGDGTNVTVTFGTLIKNQGGHFSSPTFTAPYDGFYDFSFNLVLTDIAAAHTRGFVQLVTTPRTLTICDCNIGAVRSAINTASLSGSQTVYLSATNTVSLLLNVSGSTKVVDVTSASYFSCVAQA